MGRALETAQVQAVKLRDELETSKQKFGLRCEQTESLRTDLHGQPVKHHADLETSNQKLRVACEQTGRLRTDVESVTQELRAAMSQTRATATTEVSNTESPWVQMSNTESPWVHPVIPSGRAEQPPVKKRRAPKTCSVCGMSHVDTMHKVYHPKPNGQYTRKTAPGFCQTPPDMYQPKRRRK